MEGLSKYYIVEASALPEVLLKVAKAMYDLETGKAATIGEAVRRTGISRSSFYKYRDSIRPFRDMSSASMVTFHMVLRDEPGVLSGILREFAGSSANILTINQSVPVNGVASVTISAENRDTARSMEDLLESIKRLNGVKKVEIIAGDR
jgi:chorismate mutase